MPWFDILKLFQLSIYFLIVLCSVIKFRSLGRYPLFFIIPMLITFSVEALGFFSKIMGNQCGNQYHIMGVFGLSMEMFILYFALSAKSPLWRKVLFAFAVLHLVNFSVGAILNGNFFVEFVLIHFYITVILLVLSVIIFLHDVFNSDEIIIFTSYFPFYLAFSLLFIYVGVLPCMFLRSIIDRVKDAAPAISWLLTMINLVGYSVMLLGVFFARKHQKLGA